MKSFGHKSGFESLNGSIRTSFNRENPFATDYIPMRRCENKIPCSMFGKVYTSAIAVRHQESCKAWVIKVGATSSGKGNLVELCAKGRG